MVHSIKHPILPADPRSLAQRTWWFFGLELIPIVGIFHKELHVGINMHMDNDGSIVYNIVMEVLEFVCLKT